MAIGIFRAGPPPGLTRGLGTSYKQGAMRTPPAPLLAVVSLLGLAAPGLAQDSHYWTNQYGSRATLLGGAVIGGVLDLSVTY